MTMLTSLAALALGATPVQAQSPVQSRAVTDPAGVAVATQTAPASPSRPAWKAKPKPWLASDASKPAGKLPAKKL